jgi:DNA modification methylase
MRFIPGPTSVIEEALLVWICWQKRAIRNPSPKPEKVYEKLVLMSSKKNDLIYDPMAGGGTTGAVCRTQHRKCILSDISDEYIKIIEKRLKIKRLSAKILEGLMLEVA